MYAKKKKVITRIFVHFMGFYEANFSISLVISLILIEINEVVKLGENKKKKV